MTEIQLEKKITYHGKPARIVATVRHDDRCGNGHNTFSITGDVYVGRRLDTCGCIHDLIAEHFPELREYIKWHLVSTDGPLHYIDNSLYWVKEGNLDHARSSAVWPDAEVEDITEENLQERLPALMADFKAAVESLGMEY
jgi:hypothetical protein